LVIFSFLSADFLRLAQILALGVFLAGRDPILSSLKTLQAKIVEFHRRDSSTQFERHYVFPYHLDSTLLS